MIPGIVSPMVLPWDRGDFQEVVESYGEFHEAKRDFVRTNLPLITGTTAVAAPYVAGVALVWFGPTPYHKGLGFSMLIPGPQDAAYFAAGYYAGQWIQDDIPEWLI